MLVYLVILSLTLSHRHCICYWFLDEELGFEENTEFPPAPAPAPRHTLAVKSILSLCQVEASPQGCLIHPQLYSSIKLVAVYV